MGVSRLKSIAGIAVALAATAPLAGCSGREAADATSAPVSSSAVPAIPATPATPTLPPRPETWTALQAGDCLADAPPTDPATVTVTLVDCTQPHLAEVYLRADIPVNEALSDIAGSQCEAGFTAYTGKPVAGSGYTTTYLIDSDQDRTDNNPYPSTVICLLQDAQGRSLTDSAKT
jgi:hypothetical protein